MWSEKEVRLMQGNQACAEGAIAAGVRFFAGYPITPSNEIANIMSQRLPQVGGKFIQMEDEIGSFAAAIGASLTGLKAMDATSGPGFSLKMENLGLAIMIETPVVLVNVQRVGPSIGMATSPAQGDVMQARYGTHGDYAIIAIAPSSVQEMFDAFADSEGNQVIGFFNFVQSRGETIQMLQNLDFEGFAALYNGPGQAETYGQLIQKAYDAFKRLLHD